jgi:microcin C transport system ATP-binding protein
MSLLTIDKLAVSFRQGQGADAASADIEAVVEASLDISRGETVALVGESGSGKSITGLSVLQLLPYPTAYHPHGSIRFEDEELLGAGEDRLRALRGDRIAMIFQEPMSSLNPLHPVGKQIAETLILHRGLSRPEARARALAMLAEVQLADPETQIDSWPLELSGGERQRVMIAMALANDPDLLIADEPTTALDVTTQSEILQLLKKLQNDSGLAILLITHDLGLVRTIASRVFVMHEGRTVESAPTEALFTASAKHPYTRSLLQSELPPPPPQFSEPSSPLMAARDLRVWFPIRGGLLRRTRGHVKAVDGVSFDIAPGQTLGIAGESGSGKSTLALAAVRLIASDGSIQFGDTPLQALSVKQMRPLRRQLQIVFQDPYGSLSPRLSAQQIVEEGLRVHERGMTRSQRRERVAAVMEEVGLDPQTMDRYPHEFSGGQRQRLALARVVVLKARLVILDEPTSALDRTVQVQIVQLLRDLQSRHGLCFMFISHDLRVMRALAHYVMVMRAGRIVEHGVADDLFAAPRTDYTRALVAAAFDDVRH